MLADYRAKGGRIQHSEATDPFYISGASAPVGGQNRPGDGTVRAPVKNDSEEEKPNKPSDWAPKVRYVKTIILFLKYFFSAFITFELDAILRISSLTFSLLY